MTEQLPSKTACFVSFWSDGLNIGLVLFEQADDYLKPLADWRSRQNPIDFNFAEQINRWHEEFRLSKVVACELTGIDEGKHPVKQFIKELRVEVVQSVAPFEGFAAYQKQTELGRLDLNSYPDRARLTEIMRRYSVNDTEPVMMAFLSGVAREPKLIKIRPKKPTVPKRTRLNLNDPYFNL